MTEPIRFGTDGIRGIAGQYPLSPEAVMSIGRAIGVWLTENYEDPTVLIGGDTRPSGPQIAHTLLAGLTAQGVIADDVGVISTPGVAHLTRELEYSLGIVISASHNPANQNGIKLIGADGFKLSDDAEAAIEAAIASMLANPPVATKFGVIRSADQLHDRYLQHLISGLAPGSLEGLSVVLDCANGASYELAPTAFAHLGATVTALGTSPTGHNINVRSGSEFVRRASNTMMAMLDASDAQLGVAFDGDADRVIFMTRKGTLIDGDHILGLLGVDYKQRGTLPGDTVVATTMSNSGLAYYLEQHGVKLERTRVGDRYVMARMREGGFSLGGEQAGHLILLDEEHTAGDGIYVGLQVAALVTKDFEILDRVAADIPKFPQVIASAHLSQRAPLEDVAGLQAYIDETLTAFQQQGRVEVRYSGTEPNLFRAMVEGGLNSTMPEVIERAVAICNLVADAARSEEPHIDLVDCATGTRIALETN